MCSTANTSEREWNDGETEVKTRSEGDGLVLVADRYDGVLPLVLASLLTSDTDERC